MNQEKKTDIFHSDAFFLRLVVVITLVLAVLPFLVGTMSAPNGGTYLGYQFGTDDHMVYSAWMRQAMDGHLFFDNRFTTDHQPGLTVHVYFFVLGLVAKVIGIPLAATLSRLGFSALFIVLLTGLLRRLQWKPETTRMATVFVIIGGGIGFIVWHTFGVAIVKSAPPFLSTLLGGLLPTDVWQPEGFVFPSMLVNGLFMVSLCLILTTIKCILDAKDSWKPVPSGAISIGLLMNIHSYDVLLIALVMIGFLAASFARKQVTVPWLLRSGVIVAGVIPAALWFLYVLKNDPVFQARALTDTPSANFKAVLFGYILLIVPALVGLTGRPTENARERTNRLIGVALASALIIGLYVLAMGSKEKYFLDLSGWLVAMILALVAVVLLSEDNPTINLFVSWAIVGTVAIYFPGHFQRKISMGLSIPWAVLAAYGIESMLRKQVGSTKALATALATLILGATSLRWLAREFQLIQGNTSNTTVETVYLDPESKKILDYLDNLGGKHVLLAPPGIPSGAFAQGTQENGGVSLTPLLGDLNPIASGLTGIYTYAGHWSETPDYNKRRTVLTKLYFGKLSDTQRSELIARTGADYVVAVGQDVLPIPIYDFRTLGEVVVSGTKFNLVHLKK